TLLINSKNPFKYEGLSLQVRQGVMHVDERQRSASPYYDWSLRWGKKLSEKFAFKIGGQFTKANDWQANDTRNLSRNNVFSELKGGNRQTDPNYDGVNVFGDEASASMGAFAQAVLFQAAQQATPLVTQQIAQQCNCTPTPAQVQAGVAQFLSTNPQTMPFYLGQQNNLFGNQFVSRTGYDEQYLVDYEAYNLKASGGLFYRITPSVEASLVGYWGTGTTVYTGADRYALKNLIMGQYKAEVKGANWFLRGYTTQENSGDSYTATTAAVAVNRAWKSDQTWFATYTGTYAGARLQGAPDATAHAAARNAADQGRFLPGTPEFQQAFDAAVSKPISQGGAKFADKTDLYHAEGQYNFANEINFAEVIVGASFRNYSLNSQGTIFADTAGRIGINEFGGYLQASKWLFNDVLKLTASGRYDKNENFEGRFTPRATALVKVAKDNNFRLSYQQAYRFPSTQDQWINLQTPASRLIGGLPDFITHFRFNEAPAYTAESIVAYRASVGSGTPNPTLLKVAAFNTVRPEIANSYEIGYRGLLSKRFLIDAYGYYSQYKDFIARVAVGRGQSASTNPAVSFTELASPFTTSNYSFVTNSETPVKAIGWGVTAAYQIGSGYEINANVSSDKLRDVPPGLITFFNTPELRFNIGLANENVYKNFGFNVVYRWQDEVMWEGTFGTGAVDAYGILDAQVSYRLPKIKSVFKLGGSNITNSYYQSAFGNPQIGGLYYISFGYNIF
ncbi:MAG: TonB-dependent receptor plug domain-containing protein, partial [Chitinophagaceae bacterium]